MIRPVKIISLFQLTSNQYLKNIKKLSHCAPPLVNNGTGPGIQWDIYLTMIFSKLQPNCKLKFGLFKSLGLLKLCSIHKLYIYVKFCYVVNLNLCPTLQSILNLITVEHDHNTRFSNKYIVPYLPSFICHHKFSFSFKFKWPESQINCLWASQMNLYVILLLFFY